MRLLFVLLVVVVVYTDANSIGAPQAACKGRIPLGHGAAQANPTDNPFKLLPQVTSAGVGSTITVRLTGASFKGYIIQAVTDTLPTSTPVGRFLPVQGSQTTLSCSATDDTITHMNPSKSLMPFADVTFEVPAGVQQVYFRATVVPDISVYYTDVYSLPVAIV